MLCVPEERSASTERGVLFAVADGMGGVSGGEFASRLALQTMADEYFSSTLATTPERLKEALRQANQRIYEEAEHNPQYHGMGTTVSAVAIIGDCAYVAQVGDSRVYMTREDGAIWQITDDHSLVAEQVRNGMISEEEARNHALKKPHHPAPSAPKTPSRSTSSPCASRKRTHSSSAPTASRTSSKTKRWPPRSSATRSRAPRRVLVGRALEGGRSRQHHRRPHARRQIPLPTARLEEGAVHVTLEKPGFLNKLRRLFSGNRGQ